MSDKKYNVGTKDVQNWMEQYTFAPRGLGFVEPNTRKMDSNEMAAFNVVKSFYQNYPEVFNLKYLSEKTKLKEEEIKQRLDRMYHEHLTMFAKNSAVSISG